MKKNKIIVIAGPTGVGKTKLSIDIAKKLDSEIVSCDSMQVYKYMDIGTAKISKDQMEGITHHMIDIVEPNQNFDIVEFQKKALESIKDIHSRGKIPILVGGTGFYIQSIIREIEFKSKGDNSYRNSLQMISKTFDGKNILFTLLKNIDPKSCEVIHPNNVKKIIRALEFYNENGYSIQEHNHEESLKKLRFETYFFVLIDDRKVLYEKIDNRVDEMFDFGLIDEVRKLESLGIRNSTTASQAIGYKEVLDYLDNKINIDECKNYIKLASRHYAKRQITWFNREKNVKFINKSEVHCDDIISIILNEAEENV